MKISSNYILRLHFREQRKGLWPCSERTAGILTAKMIKLSWPDTNSVSSIAGTSVEEQTSLPADALEHFLSQPSHSWGWPGTHQEKVTLSTFLGGWRVPCVLELPTKIVNIKILHGWNYWETQLLRDDIFPGSTWGPRLFCSWVVAMSKGFTQVWLKQHLMTPKWFSEVYLQIFSGYRGFAMH